MLSLRSPGCEFGSGSWSGHVELKSFLLELGPEAAVAKGFTMQASCHAAGTQHVTSFLWTRRRLEAQRLYVELRLVIAHSAQSL